MNIHRLAPESPFPPVAPADARLTMFGPDGNEGLALEVYELCQSDEPMAWETAGAKVLELLHCVRRVLITHQEAEEKARRERQISAKEIDEARLSA